MNSGKPQDALTIPELIIEGKSSEFTLETNSIKSIINGMVINTESLLKQYYPFIKSNLINITLDNVEYYKYYMQPKKLSLDLYGTIELWFLLLDINLCKSCVDFKLKNIKIFDPNKLDLLVHIFELNNKRLDDNTSQIKQILNSIVE